MEKKFSTSKARLQLQQIKIPQVVTPRNSLNASINVQSLLPLQRSQVPKIQSTPKLQNQRQITPQRPGKNMSQRPGQITPQIQGQITSQKPGQITPQRVRQINPQREEKITPQIPAKNGMATSKQHEALGTSRIVPMILNSLRRIEPPIALPRQAILKQSYTNLQEVIENPATAVVQKQITGNVAKMLIILLDGEQILITFNVPPEDCTVENLLEQARVNLHFGSNNAVYLVNHPTSEINYIVEVLSGNSIRNFSPRFIASDMPSHLDSPAVSKEDSFSTQMKFRTHSVTWTINNYDFISKTVKILKSREFPSDGEETEKWRIEFEPPEITKNNETKFRIDVKRKIPNDIHVHASLSFVSSSGIIYEMKEFIGLSSGFGWDQISGEQLYKELHWNETPGNTLIISCQVRVLESTEDVCKKISAKPFQSEDFLQDMSKFFVNDQTFQDVTISVQDKKLGAHKNILAARSQVFSAMFSNEMSEKTNSFVEIKDFRSETIEKMLRFIYTDTLDDLDFKELSYELLAAAEKYELKRLKEICIAAMVKNLTVENVLKTLEVADMYSVPDLKKAALKLAISQRQVLKRKIEFETLIVKRPRLMMEFIDIQDNMTADSRNQENFEVSKTNFEFKSNATLRQ